MLEGTPVSGIAPALERAATDAWSARSHGDRARWYKAIDELLEIPVSAVDLDRDAVRVAAAEPLDGEMLSTLQRSLMALHPWRKGPFELFGLVVDAEWRSDRKWARIAPHLSPLAGRTVLDVGSGNGYYLYRMLGAGAAAAVGVDPTQLFVAQFRALNRYFASDRAIVLPLRGEDLGALGDGISGFDTVFSMGIYYHRRSPEDHLGELAALLRPGGELVLETLVIAGDEDDELVPENRYARMRNVWSVPSVPRLIGQLESSGFQDARCVDLCVTTTEEQRRTDWMTFESLSDCLHPDDPSLTVEGYPAPLRAGIIATRAA